MQMYIPANPNPLENDTTDCTIRALSLALNEPWDKIYVDVCAEGYLQKKLPDVNSVWGAYLYKRGFDRIQLPDLCPDCYTVREFCMDNPEGVFVLALNGHVVTAIDGNYFDTFDSGSEIPIYVWGKFYA